MKLNISVFTPMPSESDRMAMSVNPGVRINRRRARLTSRVSDSTSVIGPPWQWCASLDEVRV